MIHRFFLPLVLAAAASAQLPDVKTVLNLSDTQIQSLVQLQPQKAQALQPLVQQMQQYQQKLQQLLAANPPDPAAVGAQVIQIDALSKQFQQVAGTFQQQALNVLQPDQKTKVQDLAQVLRLQLAAQQAVQLGLLSPPN